MFPLARMRRGGGQEKQSGNWVTIAEHKYDA